MFNLSKGSTILAVGAHPDDIELGCAGTLLYLKEKYGCKIHYLICSNGELRSPKDTRKSEACIAMDRLGAESVTFLSKKDGEIDWNNDNVQSFEDCINKIKPDLIFTHSVNDHHQDHVNTFRITLASCRNSNAGIICYPSINTRENIQSNLIVDITKYMKQKLSILSSFESQNGRKYMQPKFIEIKMRNNGTFGNFEFAESFYTHRLFIG